MAALESDRQQRTHQVQSDLNDIDRVVRGFQTGDELNGLKLAEWGAQVTGTLAKVGIVLEEYARSESVVCYSAADSTLLFCASKNERGQWNVLPEDDNLTPAHRKFFVNAPQTVEGVEKLYAYELEQERGAKLVKHFLSDPESFPPPLSKYQFAVAQTSEGYRFTGMQVADGNRVFEATSSQNDTGQYEVDTKLCKIPEREVEKIILREQQLSFAPQKQLEFGQPEP